MTPDDVSIRRAGDRALLLVLHDPGDVELLDHVLRNDPPVGMCDLVPAAETILLTTQQGVRLAAVERAVRARLSDAISHQVAEPDRQVVEVGVHYDGPDLAEVARVLTMTPAEVVAVHTSRLWRCRFVGFTAGFGYLRPDEPTLVVPRRDSPRTRVPAGAVALADGYSAVYPRTSPGGWQLIGTTTTAMWDLDRDRPALLTPGVAVRFVQLEA